jgi:TRAP transporter TAXI family solute receptor
MERKKRGLFGVLLFWVMISLGFFMLAREGAAQSSAPWTKPISIGSGSIGSSHYVIMSSLSALIKKYMDLSATTEATKWSADNVDLLRNKEIELSSCTSDAVYDAWKGEDYFKGKPQRFIRLIHSGYTSCGTTVARADSNIKIHADLKGKRFYAWMPTSPIYMRWCNLVMEANRLTRQNLTLMNVVSTGEAVTALIEKRCDAALIVGSIPTAGIIEVTNTIPARILPILDTEIKMMKEKYPFVFPLALPANTYKGQDKEIFILGVKTHIICRDDLPDELIYRVTKTIMEHPDEVRAIHPAAKDLMLKGFFQAIQAPFHPGAIQYYKEKGVWTPEVQKVQDEFLAGRR